MNRCEEYIRNGGNTLGNEEDAGGSEEEYIRNEENTLGNEEDAGGSGENAGQCREEDQLTTIFLRFDRFVQKW